MNNRIKFLIPRPQTPAAVSIVNDRQKLGPLLGAVILVAAPHLANLAASTMAYFGLLALWRAVALYSKRSPPKGFLLFLLTLAGAGIVFAQYHRFWGQEAGSSLFLVGLGLKLMELKTDRDAYLTLFLAFFVALTQYLFTQSIAMAAYTLAIVVLLVGAMIGLNSNEAFPFKARMKMAGFMVAQALPLMVLMFIFFPRIPGPLWHLPDDRRSAKTGVSDTLAPGSISQLGLSQATAFRVDFEGNPPPPRQRYWRGPVFWHTDGLQWTLSPQESRLSPNNMPNFGNEVYRYSLTLEPTNQRWVFALELPQWVPAELTETTDYLLLAAKNIEERRQFHLSSAVSYSTGPISEQEKTRGLQLPNPTSARISALVNRWREETRTPRELMERSLRFFHEEKFFYTLNPPLTQGDVTDSFLFETRQGFCEHYATAFVILMRVAGIPARVITGYQGGQWNNIGRFLEVKQADAHAWAEVWLPNEGWIRVDPTAAVAPERIERGLDVDTQIAAGEIRFNLGEWAIQGSGWKTEQLWRRARMVWSTMDHAWDRWVLAYGPENQIRFLEWLGLLDWKLLAGWLSALLGLILMITAWFILPRRNLKADPAQRLYERFLSKTQTWGLTRQTGEGASTFAERIRHSTPALAQSADHITRLYIRLRYERSHGTEDLKTLNRLVKVFPRHYAKPWDRIILGLRQKTAFGKGG
ncbi:MAG: DUF3488 and transglutaminase-like domain-containing protein [Methylococcaceae bacterium]|nr:DUF3488 and transglutaminase-like domain-containing protein [Methylococcaceae bacterium]